MRQALGDSSHAHSRGGILPATMHAQLFPAAELRLRHGTGTG